ncbi:MAG: 1-acyl-sn-glycerol-3-phosphate acyltransferase [Microcystaceae cyanobacterium]
MTDTLIGAQPPLDYIAPDFNPLVFQASEMLLPLWLKWQTNVTAIESENVATLAHYYQQFQQGKTRFLLAFRHPSVNDPYFMGYLLWKILPKVAKQEKIDLQSPLHAHCMYDRGIPLWAGSTVGWIYSKLGATSIQRGKSDLKGLKAARNLFSKGTMPMAAAPEGATNGHNEIISPLEPGLSQLSFWCVDDLRKAKREETVYIIPVGLQYFYLTPPWAEIKQLLTQLERETGIQSETTEQSESESALYNRLYHLGEKILTLMEGFYRDFYRQDLPEIEVNLDAPNQSLTLRLNNLLDRALTVAEQTFHLTPQGNLIDRCRRLEQAGWDWIYRDELKDKQRLSKVELGLANRIADEASLRMWHMRIVESFVAVTGHYVKEKPTVERFAETLLLLWDLVMRIQGSASFFRPNLGKQRVKITIGTPLNVSQRWPDYKSDRRLAVTRLTQDLQGALEQLIIK